MPGILTDAAVYAAIYPLLSHSVLKAGRFGKETLLELTETGAWPWVAAAVGVAFVIFGSLEATGL